MNDQEKKLLDKEITHLYNNLSPTCGGRKEDYFGLYFLQKKWGMKQEDAIKQVTFGGNDYGIDGFYFDEKRHTFIIYQFKYTEDYTQFKGTYRRLIDDGIKVVFESPNGSNYNSIIVSLNNELTKNRPVIEQVAFQFVFLGDCEKAEISNTMQALREDLEAKKHYIESRFNKQIPFYVQYLNVSSVENNALNETMSVTEGKIFDAKRTHKYELDVSTMIKYEGAHDETMTICLVKLTQLYDIYHEMGARLFDRNIRYGLGGDKPVNRAIKNSLRAIIDQKQPPEDFLFNHNGITMYVEDFQQDGDKSYVYDPRILNGAQSLTTYSEFRDGTFDSPNFKNNFSCLENVRVLCKIIKCKDPNFIVNVTINNNRQNPVEPWALHANDLIQLQFADKFKDDLGVYYERQQNAFDNLGWDEREEEGITEGRAVEIVKLAQTLLISDGRIHLVSDRRNIFTNDNIYKSIFNEEQLKSDSRKIVVCYKIQQRLNKFQNEIYEKGWNKYSLIGKARNLLWALLFQGFMNDDKYLASHIDEFGSNMRLTNQFTEYFCKLATTKCKELFAEILAKHSDDVKNERYGFLNTESSFKSCLELAKDKYKWELRHLR